MSTQAEPTTRGFRRLFEQLQIGNFTGVITRTCGCTT